MDINKPLHQVVIFLVLSSLFGFGSNFIRSDSIPWFAVELAVAESIDTDTDEAVLIAISLDQAKSFFDNGVLFIDARDEGYFESGHIKGAMKNAFLMELVFNIEQKQAKSEPLVVYCGDPGCGDSEDLAYDLQDSGFTQLYVFKGGWVEWSAASYPSETGL